MTESENKSGLTAGRFVWRELHTSNPEAAKSFYGELFGWTTKAMDMGPLGTYTLLRAGDKDVGGVVAHEGAAGWLPYCTVLDVDAAVARAKQLGAKIDVPASEIPGVGRYAVVVDRQGARIAPFTPLPRAAESDPTPSLGTFCWDELITQDPDAGLRLASALFGFTPEVKDMGALGTYTVLKRGDERAGGLMKATDARSPSLWLSHVIVADVDASFAKAKKLKATEMVPPSDIPGIGRFAVVADREGAAIALFKG